MDRNGFLGIDQVAKFQLLPNLSCLSENLPNYAGERSLSMGFIAFQIRLLIIKLLGS